MDITPLDVQYENVQDEQVPPVGLAPELMVTESSPMTSEARTLELGRDTPDRDTPVVPSEEPVQVFGYLQKQGRRLKGWHQRWFEIRGQHMYYYKTNAKRHCLGEIKLSICTNIHSISAATFGHSFELVTQERTHTLAARTIDDMDKWIDCVKRNMGPRPGPKAKKFAKVKKWDSFKNAFAITHRHRSASPQPSDPLPTTSLPVDIRQRVEVNKNKSFLNRFKLRRSNSPSNEAVLRPPEEKDSFPRPLSLRTEDLHSSRLPAKEVDPPTAVSVPNTPLTKKRREHKEVGQEDTSLTPSPSPLLLRTPGGSSGPSPQSSPERSTKERPVVSTPPNHASAPDKKTPPEKGAPIFAKPRPLVPKPTPPPRKKSPMKTQQSSPQLASDESLPEFLTQRLAWDNIKEMLESLPENSERLFSDTALPPEDEPWMEKDTPLEQLREFLAICA